ncbi:hypothetical protein HanXRQr2_Chr11g0505181 [Helianthus annuus]|uniref:Uncharacterized protein n=1 Tax=Helianthus annuus TaxID=4232 RepID=A0A9K3N149_HELAN|nr:hypothetical protein HanXRQr2_Chr11g0505181 [Helianthus annuus]
MDVNPWFERDLVDQILDGLFCVNLLTVISLFKDYGNLFNGQENKKRDDAAQVSESETMISISQTKYGCCTFW